MAYKKNQAKFLLSLPFIFVLISIVIIPFIKIVLSSFTSYNILESPTYIGLNNYLNLFTKDDIFRVAFKNSIINAVTVSIVVGTLSYIISLLNRRIPYVIKIIILLLMNLVTIFVLAGGLTFFISGDAYGSLNDYLLQKNVITEPIEFAIRFPRIIQFLTYCLVMIGPITTVLTFKISFERSDFTISRILFPFKNSHFIYIAGILPVTMLPFCRNTVMSMIGYPTNDYTTQTLTDHLMDYGTIRFELGYACAIGVVIALCIVLFGIIFIVLSCIIMNLIYYFSKIRIKKNKLLKSTKEEKNIALSVVGIFLIFLLFIILFPLYEMFMNSLKQPQDLFLFPKHFFPQSPSFKNYSQLFSVSLGNISFLKWIQNMLIVPLFPAIVLTIITALSAFGIFNLKISNQNIVLIIFVCCFLLMPVTSLPLQNLYNSIINNTYKLGFFAVFFSVAPIIGLLYFRSIINNSIKYERNIKLDLLYGCVPVILISYLICFINTNIGELLYDKSSFTIYISKLFGNFMSGGVYYAGLVVVIIIAFIFLIASLITGFYILKLHKRGDEYTKNTFE